MRAASWSEFRFHHRYFTQDLGPDYPLANHFADLGKLSHLRKELDTTDQLWKFMSGDSRWYIAMMEDPRLSLPPYRYRLAPLSLVRWLADITGASLNTTFVLVNVVAVLVAALVFTAFLRDLGFAPPIAVIGGVCFLTLPACAGTIAFPLLEPTSFLFTALIFLAAHRRKPLLFAVCAVLGVLTKEILLFSALLWVLGLNAPTWRHVLRALPVAAIPLLAFVVVRLLVGGGTIEINYGFNLLEGEFPDKYLSSRMNPIGAGRFLFAAFNAFNLLWLGLFCFKTAPRFIRRTALIIPLTLCAAAVLSSQTARVIGVIFPVVIPLFLSGLSHQFAMMTKVAKGELAP